MYSSHLQINSLYSFKIHVTQISLNVYFMLFVFFRILYPFIILVFSKKDIHAQCLVMIPILMTSLVHFINLIRIIYHF